MKRKRQRGGSVGVAVAGAGGDKFHETLRGDDPLYAGKVVA